MYDLEKASKSAPGISLYVSDDPQGSNEVLGPEAPNFPDQDGALVYDLGRKLQASSRKLDKIKDIKYRIVKEKL